MLPGGGQSSALSVNALFQAVGSFQNGSTLHAVLWDNGQVIDLGGGPRGVTEADCINNLGQIVGDAQFGGLIYENGTWKDLLSLTPAGSGWSRLSFAFKINDRGQIVGAGNLNGDTTGSRAYLMTPLRPVTPRMLIISPTNQQCFSAGVNVSCSGWLVPDAGNLAKVDWYSDGALIGTRTNAPYDLTWQNIPSGQHLLWARTTSASGATATSQIVSVTVAGPPTLAWQLTSNQLQFSWPTSYLGLTIESATNLNPPVAWSPVGAPIQNSNGLNWMSIGATNDSRYFRLHGP
jgi:uncharacterized membrane protein